MGARQEVHEVGEAQTGTYAKNQSQSKSRVCPGRQPGVGAAELGGEGQESPAFLFKALALDKTCAAGGQHMQGKARKLSSSPPLPLLCVSCGRAVLAFEGLQLCPEHMQVSSESVPGGVCWLLM